MFLWLLWTKPLGAAVVVAWLCQAAGSTFGVSFNS